MQTMTKRSLPELIIKLMGLYVILQGVPVLAQLPSMMNLSRLGFVRDVGDFLESFVILLIPVAGVLIYLVVGYLLIKKSRRLAERLFPEDESIRPLQAFSLESIAKMTIIALGLLIAVKYLSSFLEVVIHDFIKVYRVGNLRHAFTPREITNSIKLAIPFLVALFLMFRPDTVYRLIMRTQPRIDSESMEKDNEAEVVE